MSGVLLAETAVLVQLDAVGGVLLVLHGVVVTLLALGAGQHNLVTGNACHVGHLLLKCGQKPAARPLTGGRENDCYAPSRTHGINFNNEIRTKLSFDFFNYSCCKSAHSYTEYTDNTCC